MRISKSFANRSDLSRFDKFRFTVEERVAENARIRALYRKYFFSPCWVSGSIDAFCIFSVMVPFALAALCGEVVKKIIGDDRYEGAAGLVIYLLGVLAFAWFHPLGLVLTGLTLWATLVLWFCFGVMDEYGQELWREAEKKKWDALHTRLVSTGLLAPD